MLAFRRGLRRAVEGRDRVSSWQASSRAAIAILEQLRREKPDDLVLMAHLGQVYVAAGRDADGVAAARARRRRAQPDRFEAHVDLATGYMHQGDLAKARAAAERAVSLNRFVCPGA